MSTTRSAEQGMCPAGMSSEAVEFRLICRRRTGDDNGPDTIVALIRSFPTLSSAFTIVAAAMRLVVAAATVKAEYWP
jgi:hypothetical protein